MLASIIIFVVCYLFIASEKIDRTVVALLGAAAMIMLHLIPYEDALAKVDLNVVFLLVGMMVIVGILAETGVFEWIAIVTARKAGGNGLLIMALLVLVTAVLSAFLDNVTTVILIAPITILVTQILELPTVPFLIMEAVFSNAGGTATLVGDPPNIIIGSETIFDFNDFLLNLTPIILVVLAVFLVLQSLLFRNVAQVPDSAKARIAKAQPARAIVAPRLLRRTAPVFLLVLVGFFTAHALDVEPGIIALAGAVIMVAVSGLPAHTAFHKVEWSTILFFIGLFMLIGALDYNGVFLRLGRIMLDLTHGNLLVTTLTILWASAVISAIVDNIPLVIAMIPLIKSIVPAFVAALHIAGQDAAIHARVEAPLFWALALGACLGGNGTLIGASANVVVSQIAIRNNYRLSFMDFSRYGFPFMLVSLALSSAYLYLRYFLR